MCFDLGIVTCGPNEALVISGMFQGDTPSLLTGNMDKETLERNLLLKIEIFCQVVGRLFVLEFKPSSASTSPPWHWRSSIWKNWITRNPSTWSKSLGGCTFCLFLWSLDQNFKIERALHFVIQLWINCKKALRSDSLECQTQNFGALLFFNYDWHIHVYKFTRIDCPSHYLEENIEQFLYLQYSECVHESRSRNIS